MSGNVGFAFALTVFAGLSTGLGSAIAFFFRRENKTFLSASLGFSTGVMVYISFVELFQVAREHLEQTLGDVYGNWIVVGSFFCGVVITALIDFFVPDYENPHELESVEKMEDGENDPRLNRLGIMSAFAIALHNFPEGMAVFAAALLNPAIGISVAVAIAIHNIPEGISISVPIYHATGSRKKAFWLSFLSGLAEPLGALVAYFFLRSFLNDTVFGILFAAVAGIMVFISLDQLLPAAKRFDKGHASVYGLVAGMAVMALSLLLGA